VDGLVLVRIRVGDGRSCGPPIPVILSPQAKNLFPIRKTSECTTPLRREILHFVRDDDADQNAGAGKPITRSLHETNAG